MDNVKKRPWKFFLLVSLASMLLEVNWAGMVVPLSPEQIEDLDKEYPNRSVKRNDVEIQHDIRNAGNSEFKSGMGDTEGTVSAEGNRKSDHIGRNEESDEDFGYENSANDLQNGLSHSGHKSDDGAFYHDNDGHIVNGAADVRRCRKQVGEAKVDCLLESVGHLQHLLKKMMKKLMKHHTKHSGHKKEDMYVAVDVAACRLKPLAAKEECLLETVAALESQVRTMGRLWDGHGHRCRKHHHDGKGPWGDEHGEGGRGARGDTEEGHHGRHGQFRFHGMHAVKAHVHGDHVGERRHSHGLHHADRAMAGAHMATGPHRGDAAESSSEPQQTGHSAAAAELGDATLCRALEGEERRECVLESVAALELRIVMALRWKHRVDNRRLEHRLWRRQGMYDGVWAGAGGMLALVVLLRVFRRMRRLGKWRCRRTCPATGFGPGGGSAEPDATWQPSSGVSRTDRRNAAPEEVERLLSAPSPAPAAPPTAPWLALRSSLAPSTTGAMAMGAAGPPVPAYAPMPVPLYPAVPSHFGGAHHAPLAPPAHPAAPSAAYPPPHEATYVPHHAPHGAEMMSAYAAPYKYPSARLPAPAPTQTPPTCTLEDGSGAPGAAADSGLSALVGRNAAAIQTLLGTEPAGHLRDVRVAALLDEIDRTRAARRLEKSAV